MKMAFRLERGFVNRVTHFFWERRSPDDLAHARRQAVRRAYGHFARRYPRWANSLFDEHFVNHGAQEVLTRGLLRAEAVADAWTRQLHYRDEAQRQRHAREILPVAEIFIRLVRAEMV